MCGGSQSRVHAKETSEGCLGRKGGPVLGVSAPRWGDDLGEGGGGGMGVLGAEVEWGGGCRESSGGTPAGPGGGPGLHFWNMSPYVPSAPGLLELRGSSDRAGGIHPMGASAGALVVLGGQQTLRIFLGTCSGHPPPWRCSGAALPPLMGGTRSPPPLHPGAHLFSASPAPRTRIPCPLPSLAFFLPHPVGRPWLSGSHLGDTHPRGSPFGSGFTSLGHTVGGPA